MGTGAILVPGFGTQPYYSIVFLYDLYYDCFSFRFFFLFDIFIISLFNLEQCLFNAYC